MSRSYGKDNEYYTPKRVVSFFGRFDYDPATTREYASYLGIPNYDTIETDGLVQDWTPYGRIWINPPFTRKQEFLVKAWETYKQVANEIYVLVPVEFLTTQKFHDSIGGGRIYIPSGRINFQSGIGKKGKSPAFGSCIIKLGDEWELETINKDIFK